MKTLIAVVFCASSAFAQWNTAKVISFDMNKSTVSNQTFVANQSGNTTTGAVNNNNEVHRNYSLVLEDGDTLLYAERTLESPLQRAPAITENASIKYKVDKNKLTVVEENGRSFKMNLVKRRKKS